MGTLAGGRRAAARKLGVSYAFYEKQLRDHKRWCTVHRRFCSGADFAAHGRRNACLPGERARAEERRERLREAVGS